MEHCALSEYSGSISRKTGAGSANDGGTAAIARMSRDPACPGPICVNLRKDEVKKRSFEMVESKRRFQRNLPSERIMSMSTVPQISQTIEWIVQEYPRQMERKTGFVQRSTARLDGPTFVQSLVFGWMARPQASYTHLRHVADTLGASVSKQAVEQRFSQSSVELLKAVLQEAGKQVICSDGQVAPLLSRFHGVYLQDGSIVSLPEELTERYGGCGGSTEHSAPSSLRLQVRWEMGRGGLQGPWLQAGREAERSGEAIETPMPAGSLLVSDIGYFTLQDMRKRGVDHFWITGAKSQLCLYDSHGVKYRLETFLKLHQQETQIDCWVQVAAQERLPVRFIAVRVSNERAIKTRERARVITWIPPHR